jgi:hypothetical protein
VDWPATREDLNPIIQTKHVQDFRAWHFFCHGQFWTLQQDKLHVALFSHRRWCIYADPDSIKHHNSRFWGNNGIRKVRFAKAESSKLFWYCLALSPTVGQKEPFWSSTHSLLIFLLLWKENLILLSLQIIRRFAFSRDIIFITI